MRSCLPVRKYLKSTKKSVIIWICCYETWEGMRMAKIKTFDTTAVYLTAAFKAKMKMVTQYSCTLVEAPMGYGKTKGVREFLNSLNIRVLWQRLHDNSLSGFWKDFCRLFRELDVDCYESLMQIGFPISSNTKVSQLR